MVDDIHEIVQSSSLVAGVLDMRHLGDAAM
jgi:hypothetical protein